MTLKATLENVGKSEWKSNIALSTQVNGEETLTSVNVGVNRISITSHKYNPYELDSTHKLYKKYPPYPQQMPGEPRADFNTRVEAHQREIDRLYTTTKKVEVPSKFESGLIQLFNGKSVKDAIVALEQLQETLDSAILFLQRQKQ